MNSNFAVVDPDRSFLTERGLRGKHLEIPDRSQENLADPDRGDSLHYPWPSVRFERGDHSTFFLSSVLNRVFGRNGTRRLRGFRPAGIVGSISFSGR